MATGRAVARIAQLEKGGRARVAVVGKERQVNHNPTRSRRRPSGADNKDLTPSKMRGEKAAMETNELSGAWKESAKKAVELYLESGEKLGKMMLEWHEQSTSWAKETMIAPLLEAQRKASKQLMESSAETTRKLFGIAKNGL
jgi:hypothetical protein